MSRRILVVDDSPIILAAVRHALSAAGYACATCGTFEELERHDVNDFDLVLMDVQMPELYGDDVGVALRQRNAKTPIYLFSTIDESELATRAKEAGLDGYISKKRGMEHLVAELAKIFQ
jgi:two-component system response regulator FimZ (fimbrial Z protein)